jgi:hypothetical protein
VNFKKWLISTLAAFSVACSDPRYWSVADFNAHGISDCPRCPYHTEDGMSLHWGRCGMPYRGPNPFKTAAASASLSKQRFLVLRAGRAREAVVALTQTLREAGINTVRDELEPYDFRIDVIVEEDGQWHLALFPETLNNPELQRLWHRADRRCLQKVGEGDGTEAWSFEVSNFDNRTGNSYCGTNIRATISVLVNKLLACAELTEFTDAIASSADRAHRQ